MRGIHLSPAPSATRKRLLPAILACFPAGVVVGLLAAKIRRGGAPIRRFSDQEVSLESPVGLYAPPKGPPPFPALSQPSLKDHSRKGLHSSSPTLFPTSSTTKGCLKAKLLRGSGLVKAIQQAGGHFTLSALESREAKHLGFWEITTP